MEDTDRHGDQATGLQSNAASVSRLSAQYNLATASYTTKCGDLTSSASRPRIMVYFASSLGGGMCGAHARNLASYDTMTKILIVGSCVTHNTFEPKFNGKGVDCFAQAIFAEHLLATQYRRKSTRSEGGSLSTTNHTPDYGQVCNEISRFPQLSSMTGSILQSFDRGIVVRSLMNAALLPRP